MNRMTFASRPLARLVSALLVAAAAMGADTLTLTAPATTLALNGTVQVTVGLSGAGAFSVWGECLTWDKTKLQLVSQDTFTAAYGTPVADSRSVSDINASGEVRSGGYYVSGTTYPNNTGGSDKLGVFTFKRIAAGSVVLTALIKNGTYPFGAVLIDVAGTQRVPAATAMLTFTDVNTAPTITTVTNPAAITAGNSTAALAFTVGDAQTAVGSLTVTRASSNLTAVPLANVVLGGSGASRTVTVAGATAGTSTITLTVTDAGGLTANSTFTVTVTPTNTAPTITAIANPASIFIGAMTPALAFTVGDAQTAAGSLTVTRASSNLTAVPLANVVPGGSGAGRTLAVTGAAAGTSLITLTVSDGVLTASTSLTVTVTVDPAAGGGGATPASNQSGSKSSGKNCGVGSGIAGLLILSLTFAGRPRARRRQA